MLRGSKRGLLKHLETELGHLGFDIASLDAFGAGINGEQFFLSGHSPADIGL